jgi:hypothetical protein
MKRTDKKILVTLVAFVAVILAIGFAGEYDWTEQTILHMSADQYEWVKDTLKKITGEQPSDNEIAHWWAEHHQEWN